MTTNDQDGLDHLVIGGGLRGLRATRSLRSANPSAHVRLVERNAAPGGSARTLRSEGYSCELGRFALTETDLGELIQPLPKMPPAVSAMPTAGTGHLWNGQHLLPIAVTPAPWSFRGGLEDLVTAYRRELGDSLLLGRAATALTPMPDGWTTTLVGEVPAAIAARRVTMALSTTDAARLLAQLDPRLQDTSQRLATDSRAFLFAGFTAADAHALTGYGVLPADGVTTDLAEAIFCTNVFERRAMPGHALVRIEVGGELARRDDPDLAAAAVAELGRWTGLTARPRFLRVHRFTLERRDAAWLECRARIQALVQLATGLHWLPPRD